MDQTFSHKQNIIFPLLINILLQKLNPIQPNLLHFFNTPKDLSLSKTSSHQTSKFHYYKLIINLLNRLDHIGNPIDNLINRLALLTNQTSFFNMLLKQTLKKNHLILQRHLFILPALRNPQLQLLSTINQPF